MKISLRHFCLDSLKPHLDIQLQDEAEKVVQLHGMSIDSTTLSKRCCYHKIHVLYSRGYETSHQCHIMLYKISTLNNICDMIKGNESDVGNIDFELQAKRGGKFLYFTLFLNLKKCSYLCNQMSDWDGVWIKMQHFKWTSDLNKKSKIEYCRHVTHSPWSCHILVLFFIQRASSHSCKIITMPLDGVTWQKRYKSFNTTSIFQKINSQPLATLLEYVVCVMINLIKCCLSFLLPWLLSTNLVQYRISWFEISIYLFLSYHSKETLENPCVFMDLYSQCNNANCQQNYGRTDLKYACHYTSFYDVPAAK